MSYSTYCILPNFLYLFSCLFTCESTTADSTQPHCAPSAFPNMSCVLRHIVYVICIHFSTRGRVKSFHLSFLSFSVDSLEGRYLVRPRRFFTSFPVLGFAMPAHSCLHSVYLTVRLSNCVRAHSRCSLKGRV